MIPVQYNDVFGRKPTRDNLVTFVRELPWRDLVMKCSAIALLSWQRGVEDQTHQVDLVENLLASHPSYERKLRAILAEDTPRILLTRETLLALLRVATIEQSEGRELSAADW